MYASGSGINSAKQEDPAEIGMVGQSVLVTLFVGNFPARVGTTFPTHYNIKRKY